jgi:putative ATPase
MGEISTEVMKELHRSLNSLGEGGLRLPMRHQLITGERDTP